MAIIKKDEIKAALSHAETLNSRLQARQVVYFKLHGWNKILCSENEM